MSVDDDYTMSEVEQAELAWERYREEELAEATWELKENLDEGRAAWIEEWLERRADLAAEDN